jgi:UDP-N-acetylmuramoyl-L-alanyl-D-glutamate--2,6-diaminopimelate ligase
MLLSKLIACSKNLSFEGRDVDITGLTEDSRKVERGYLFIATPGTKQDGSVFIADALKKGASAVLVARDVAVGSLPVPVVRSETIREATALLAATFFSSQPETIVAITGTSGKTSTAQFVRELWQTLGHQSASVGTLGMVSAGGTKYGSLTTPDAITLHHILNDCVHDKITHVALEASSHGIDLHRLDQIKFQAAGFTNLSRDHLDYHQTMEAYFAAKLKLFTELLPRGATAVLNADIERFPPLAAAARERGQKILSYGSSGQELKLLDIKTEPSGQVLSIDLFGIRTEAFLPIIGKFQAWNVLCAAGLVIGSGGDPNATLQAFPTLTGVPGRLQFIGRTPNGGNIFVDYAHKPDALVNVLQALRPHAAAQRGKLGIIFGCGGNRDKGKRPIMGNIAQKEADWVIITDDNPRHEDPATIRSEILAGCSDRSNVQEVGDRATAISEGIEKLKENDILIIAGKGHEPGQIIGDTVLPFDDAEETRKVLGL